jgi:RNA polymerase sigma-70 factor (sigma-E family)
LGLDVTGKATAMDVLASAAPAVPVAFPRSFDEVYRTDYKRLVQVAHLITGSNETAEDVVQDAFVRLYDRFDTIGDPGGYLYRSVVNGCWQGQRRRRVVERLRHLTAQSDIVAASEIDEMWTALRQLPPRRRAVIVLRFYADLPLAEIAEVLECRLGTVKSMLHRALAELREVIDG